MWAGCNRSIRNSSVTPESPGYDHGSRNPLYKMVAGPRQKYPRRYMSNDERLTVGLKTCSVPMAKELVSNAPGSKRPNRNVSIDLFKPFPFRLLCA